MFVFGCTFEELGVTQRVFPPQPIFKMSAQQNQLQNVTESEYKAFCKKYLDDVSLPFKCRVSNTNEPQHFLNFSELILNVKKKFK